MSAPEWEQPELFELPAPSSAPRAVARVDYIARDGRGRVATICRDCGGDGHHQVGDPYRPSHPLTVPCARCNGSGNETRAVPS